ncbi:hypothetical protein HNP99_001503 [Flavobacterium sp. 28A]|uniref:lipoprotein N-acyltransferase Lnb domain-containing protein n=1 Tax=Flavobacterium sp. 28A TaxID=2735895 RepID=UPI00156F45F3|nr:DUF4105 domain-containing protein [Flavobacterium sp. 28A]NRT15156.1 hypothetical protein [Flavobacterium sp. 28A]
MKTSFLQIASLYIFLICSISNLSAQKLTLSNETKVSVLTCGTGNESYSLFGHTAIRIADPKNFIDIVYNYGAFDFNTPNFVLKFVKGDLQYFAVAHPYTDFINEYTYEKRAVYEQELNVSQQLKQDLFDNLKTSLSSGESYYTYKFIDKNCTSMVVDILNKTLKTKAIVKNADTNLTYRTILFPYFDHHFYEKLGTSIIFGEKVDRMGTQIFLPFELMKSLEKTSFENHLLANKTHTILSYETESPFSWWNNAYTYLLLLAIVVLINSKSVNQFYLLIMALLGAFFVFAGFYSFHQELAWNYNILLFNPLLFILLYFIITKNSGLIYKLTVANLLCLAIYVVLLINKAHVLIVLPMVFTSATILVRLAIKNKKKIPIII